MIDLFEYALALTAHGNFARAAKQLGISQPTLTRGIQELEERLGARLFDRTPRGVFPTAVGEIVIDGARRITQCVDELKKEVRSFEDLDRAQVTLGVGPLVAQTWMPDAVITLLRQYPSMEIHVSTFEWWELIPQLLNREIELAIGELIEDIGAHSDIAVIPLPHRPLAFFCRADHPLTTLKNPTMEQIGQYPMASTKLPLRAAEDFGGTRTLGKLAQNGIYFEPQISCPTFDVCFRIIKNTDNIGIAPVSQLARLDSDAGLSVIPFDAPSLRTNYGIMHLRNRSLSPSAMVFLEHAVITERVYNEKNSPLHTKLSPRSAR
jgi:DNA-binding transcriptional LysR family regulator